MSVPDALVPDGPARPDPALGVGTTLLVAGGRVHDLDAHLERLAASAREVLDAEPAADLADELRTLGAAGARVRAEVLRDGSTRVRSQPFTPPPPDAAPLRTAPFRLPGGLGAHSWNDGRLARNLARRAGEGTLAVLLDDDGEVLEAIGAALLVVEGRHLVAAPRDDRRLRSTAEARMPVVAHERLDAARLLAADAVVAVSAVHGVRRVDPAGLRPAR